MSNVERRMSNVEVGRPRDSSVRYSIFDIRYSTFLFSFYHYPLTTVSTNHGRFRPIVARVINFCWRCFKWGLLLGAVGLGVGTYYLYGRFDEQIRRQVEQLLAGHYSGMSVTVRAASLLNGEGIEVRGLSIRERGAGGPRAELLYVDEMLLCCTTDLKELLTEPPEVTRIRVRRPVLRVTRRPDGSLSIARLFPPPKLSDRPPETSIENGTIEIFDPIRTPATTLVLRNLNLTIRSGDPEKDSPQVRKLEGTLGGDHLRRIELSGRVDPETSSWSVAGSIDGLEIAPELRDSLPGPLAQRLAVLGELRGHASVDFQVTYDARQRSPLGFVFSGRLERGRIDDPRLPYPLSELQARFRIHDGGVRIDGLTGRSGQATLRLSYNQAGLDWSASPFELQAEIRRLELDRTLRDSLPPALQDQWNKFLPTGLADADVKLGYNDGAWRSDVTLRCLSVGFTFHRFPYRLEDGRGVVRFKDDRAEVHLTAYSRSEPVRIDAQLENVSGDPYGLVEAKSETVELDKKLLLALNERGRRALDALAPRGRMSAFVRLTRDGPGRPWHKYALMRPDRCSLRPRAFPYPLSNVRGVVEMAGDEWTFRNLEATNDTARLSGHGRITGSGPDRRLELHVSGTDVPLEEELRSALRPGAQRLWSGLRPQGRVDVETDLAYVYGPRQLSVAVRARPQTGTTSVEPVYLPYEMQNIRGLLEYRDGRLTLDGVRAEHGAVNITTDGHCEFRPDGTWRFTLDGLSVDRLRLEDRELAAAMPEGLRRTVLQLKPAGPVNLRGDVTLSGDAGPQSPIGFQWDLLLGFHQGSLDAGLKLENLFGTMTLKGTSRAGRFRCQGELDLDSLSYRDFQVTEVRGPFFVDNARVGLGNWAERFRREGPAQPAAGKPASPRPLTARLFGGTLYGDVWVALGEVSQYAVRAHLAQGDLSRAAREVIAGKQDLRGAIYADVELAGAGRSLNALGGRGRLWLREADVYELSVMVRLLKILSIREPNRTAFSKSDVDFVVRGGHIYFPRINFNGDAVSLLGQGEMDFQKNVHLTFHAVVGRDEVHVPILREVMGGASQQVMQIQVDGPLTGPEVRKIAFPGVNQALQQLQEDMQRSLPPPPMPPPRVGTRPR